MENLSPHRRFRGASYVEPLRGHRYHHPWPKDLPKACEICGTEFRSGWNLEITPNRIGRILGKSAKLAFIPCVIGAFVVPLLFSGIMQDFMQDYGGWYFFGLILTPALLGFASLFAPIKRHVECKKCGWNRDYPVPKLTPIPADGEKPISQAKEKMTLRILLKRLRPNHRKR